MRLKDSRVGRVVAAFAVLTAAVVVGVLYGVQRAPVGSERAGEAGDPVADSIAQEMPSLAWVKPGTREVVRQVETRGRAVRVETAESTDGETCLLDTDLRTGATGATCSREGLFSVRKVAFSINVDGGPVRFDSMTIVGLAAPGIASVEVQKSDGSALRTELDRTRAFVIESAPSELERQVFPSALKLYARGGRLVESVEIPAPR